MQNAARGRLVEVRQQARHRGAAVPPVTDVVHVEQQRNLVTLGAGDQGTAELLVLHPCLRELSDKDLVMLAYPSAELCRVHLECHTVDLEAIRVPLVECQDCRQRFDLPSAVRSLGRMQVGVDRSDRGSDRSGERVTPIGLWAVAEFTRHLRPRRGTTIRMIRSRCGHSESRWASAIAYQASSWAGSSAK